MSLPEPYVELLGTEEYRVPRPPGRIDLWLDSNEGPAPAASASEALQCLDPEVLRRYPRPGELEMELAGRFSVDAERVLVTAGADEAIDRFCRAFLREGRNAVILTPAFEMQTRYVQLAGAEIREVLWTDGPMPIEAILDRVDAATGVIAIASPNNPTGLEAPAAAIEELARRAPDVWLFLDLVYADFLGAGDPTERWLTLPNALLARSFSKSAGLAGLRVGYAMGPRSAVAAMRRAGGPYSVAGPSLAVARRFLRESANVHAGYRSRIRDEREALAGLLSEVGIGTTPSSANFVLARTAHADWLWEGLAGFGIAVRRFADRPGLEDGVRITCPGEEGSFARLCRGIHVTMAPEAILFDMDGVLVDVRESYDRAIAETAASFGLVVTRATIAEAKAEGDANNDWRLTWRLLQDAGVEVSLSEVTRVFEDAYQSRLWKEETLCASPDVLRRLARRIPLGIVTGRPRRDAERFLSSMGLSDSGPSDGDGVGCFSTVVCMEDAPLKPSPEPVALAMRQLGVERVWFVGDTVDDVRAARAAGALPVGVVPPGDDPSVLGAALFGAGAATVYPSFSDNLTAIEEFLS